MIQGGLVPLSARFQRAIRLSPLTVYAASLAGVAMLLVGALVASGFRLEPLWAVACLMVLSAIAEESRVRLSRNLELSISLLPTLFAAVALGPLAAMVVASSSMIGEFRRDRVKWIVYSLSEAVTGGITGLAVLAAANASDNAFGSIVVATIAGVVSAQSLDLLFCSITVTIRRVAHPGDVARTLIPVILASVPLYAPVVALLAYAYIELSEWSFPFFLVPVLAAQRLFVMYQDQRQLTDELVEVNTRLERASLSFATALVATVEARDRYTAGHSAAVAVYARDIANRMGLPESTQQLAHLCGLVHDVGKIGLPAGLLEKPGALTLEERRQMEEHPAIGERILRKVEDYAEIAGVVRHHHERWDGAGYPDGLVADDIPLLSRVIAVADAYNAMTSDRPYRDAMPTQVARMRLAQAVGSQFDTTIVAAFEAILATAHEAYRRGVADDFLLEAQELYRSRTAA
jgi:putative nucleotidyltransferase with HDIG domain